MPIKPLTHLRPLLRLPTSHQSSPDHFSSNPSLLHHLSSNQNQGLTLGGQHAPSSGGSGGSSGAGKAGWGNSGAGAGGGGYTGHGRAFLSLPHTGIVDPSSSITSSSSDEQQRKSARSALILQHRLSRQVRIVNLEEGRTVHRQIESRAGSRLGVIDLEDSPPRDHSLLEVEDTRPSIAFPTHPPATPRSTHSPLPRVLSPSTPHSRSPSSRSSLHRSTSSLDLWQVVPRQLSLRSISTAAGSVAEVEEGLGLSEALPRDAVTITRSSPRRPTPTLMDLAGVDLPIQRHDRMFVRRNSTAYMPQTNEHEERTEDEIVSNLDHNPDQTISIKPFLARLHDESNTDQQIEQLVAYYRAPRGSASESEFASIQLPKKYQTHAYNACLGRLLQIRQPGQSIAGIVEIYNEMLARDCRPNRDTYNFLIQAFAEREQDVWKAINQWEMYRARDEWRDAAFGKVHDTTQYAAQDEMAQGYRSEANLANAFKLIRAVKLSAPPPLRTSGKPHLSLLTQEAEHQLFQACAAGQIAPDDLGLVKELYLDRAWPEEIHYGRAQKMLALLARAKDVDGLKDFWAMLLEKDANSQHPPDKMAYQRLPAFAQAATSFFAVGEMDLGMEVVNVFCEKAERGEFGNFAAYSGTLGTTLTELVKMDRVDEMVSIHTRLAEVAKKIDPTADRPLHPASYRDLVDALVVKGHWRVAWPLIEVFCGGLRGGGSEPQAAPTPGDFPNSKQPGFIDPRTRALLYTAILSEASSKDITDPEVITLLDLTKTITRYTRPITFRDDLFKMHMELLGRLGRYEDIAELDKHFVDKPNLPAVIVDHLLGVLSKAIHSEDATLPSILSLWAHPNLASSRDARRKPTRLSAEDGLALGTKYLDARQKVGEVTDLGIENRQWMELARGLLDYPQEEPELDDVLVQLVEDLGAAFTKPQESNFISRASTTRSLVRRLFHRFGEDRASQMVITAYGSERGQELVAVYERSLPQAVPPLDLSGKATEAPDASEASEPLTPTPGPIDAPRGPFTLPPPPDYFGSIPPLSPLFLTNPPPRVSESLTTTIQAELDRLIRSRQLPNRKRLFAMVTEQLKQYYVVPSIGTLSRMIDQLCRVDNKDPKAKYEADLHVRQLYALGYLVLPTLRSTRNQWQGLENAMLVGLCNLGQLVEAGHHRSRLIASGLAPGADAYATMISSAKDTTDDAVVATQLWEECQAYGVRPNLYLYNTIISKLSKARKAEMALGLFVEMKEKGLHPSSVTYGAVINACCRVGDGQSAATLFNEMAAQRNFKPRVPPFNTMMQFHLTTSPNRDAVLHYFNTLVSTGCPPSAHTYKLLLDAYAVLQPLDLDSFERVFAELVADPRVPVQGTHWASLISAHGIYASDYPKALEIFRSIPSHPSASVNLATEPVIWEAILNVISQKSTVENLEAMHREMVDLGAQATAYVYNILIGGYARAGQIDNARSVFNSMGDSVSGVAAPNNHPTLLTSSGHVKPSTITDQPTSVVYREPSTYEAMIRAELDYGSRENAQSVLGMMKERRYPVAVYLRAENLISDHVLAEGTRPPPVANSSFGPVDQLRPAVELGYASPERKEKELENEPAAVAAPVTAEDTSSPTEPASSESTSTSDPASSPPTSATADSISDETQSQNLKEQA